jgi:hypothetical protein
MYNPEIRYIIEQEHGELMPVVIPPFEIGAVLLTIIGSKFIGSKFIGSKFIGSKFIGSKFIGSYYKIAMLPFEYIWSILTPGNELLELALIAISIFTGVMWILTMNELTKKLDISFEKLKTQLKEKDLRIVELESELEGLKNEDKCKNISKNK